MDENASHRTPRPRTSASDEGRLRYEAREPHESRPFRAVRASRSAVSLPDNEVGGFVANHFAPTASVKAIDFRVELHETLVSQQLRDRRRQTRVKPKSKPHYVRVSPDTCQ